MPRVVALDYCGIGGYMSDEPKSVLQQLRKTFKGRLSRCTAFDPNVCAYHAKPDRPWELIATEGQPFLRELRFAYRKRNVVMYENENYVRVSVRGEFTGRRFTVNAKDPFNHRWTSAGNVAAGARSNPVFTPDGILSEHEENLFRRPEFIALLIQTDMRDGESMQFAQDSIRVYLKVPTVEHVHAVIDCLIELVDKIEVLEEPLNLMSLPARFHALIPLIRKWAISDDEDRTDLLRAASRAALKKMVEEVSPYFEEIGSYLASFGETPPPEAACALGTLAECFMEAELEIAKGKGSG